MGNCNQLAVSYLRLKYKLLQQISDNLKSSISDWAKELPLQRLLRSKEETAVKDDWFDKPINHAWTETKPTKPMKKEEGKHH